MLFILVSCRNATESKTHSQNTTEDDGLHLTATGLTTRISWLSLGILAFSNIDKLPLVLQQFDLELILLIDFELASR
jgi:hypothetical protein